MSDKQKQVKSKKRVADFGEGFTAEKEVNAMLNLLPETIWHNITARFLEPACGNGNFLAKILEWKLDNILVILKAKKIPKKKQPFPYEFYAIQAVSSIYGIEILTDNCNECRERLLNVFINHYQLNIKKTNVQIIKIIQYLLSKNIVNGDTLFDTPIIFSEWAFVGEMVYRTECVYQEKVENKVYEGKEYRKNYDLHKKYPPIHYLKLSEQENV